MYYKGANLLHTIRQVINDDEKWRLILRGLNSKFYHQTVTSAEVEKYISSRSGFDLIPVFDQYLRDIRIPVLSYVVKGKTLQYRWENVVPNFAMPVKISVNGTDPIWITPSQKWNSLELDMEKSQIKVDPNFYVSTLNISGD